MDLLLSSDVFLSFFKNYNKVEKSEIDKFLDNLFRNNSVRFIISKALINLVESDLKETNVYDSIYVPIMSHIIDNKSLSIKPGDSSDEKVIHVYMHENYQNLPNERKKDVFMHITHSQFSLNKVYSVEIDKAVQPNKHFVGLNLASYGKVTFRYYDFSRNDSVVDIVNFIIGIQTHIPVVHIYDRYVNLEHDFFNSFKKSKFVYYYTKSRKVGDLQYMIQDLKISFNKFKLFTAHSDIIHERRIIVNNTIFEADEDFWSLTTDRPTWKVSIEHCSNTVSSLMKKNNLFKEFIVR